MDLISFRCTSCNQSLKIGADKAGRRIKCTKCGTPLTVPHAEVAPSDAASAGSQLPAEERAKKTFDDEDDNKKGYGLFVDPAAEEEERKKREEKPKKDDKK